MVQNFIFYKVMNKYFRIINQTNDQWYISIQKQYFEYENLSWIAPCILTKLLNTQTHRWSCLPLDFITAEVYWYLQNQSRLHVCVHGDWARWSFICPFSISMNPLRPLKVRSQHRCCHASSSFAFQAVNAKLSFAMQQPLRWVNVYAAHELIKVYFCFYASKLHS